MLSWLRLQQAGNWHELDVKWNIPSIKEMQEIIQKIESREVSFIGSREWIGSFEVMGVISKLTDVDSVIFNVSDGSEVIEKLDQFERHFQEVGSPIMIGKIQIS